MMMDQKFLGNIRPWRLESSHKPHIHVFCLHVLVELYVRQDSTWVVKVVWSLAIKFVGRYRFPSIRALRGSWLHNKYIEFPMYA